MSEKATTWRGLLDRRNRRRLVGRRREIEQFRLNYLYEVPESLLFFLQGPEGIGKSALLAAYRSIAEEHGVLTASVSRWEILAPREFAVLQAMTTIADDLSASGMPLMSFREIHREIVSTLRTILGDPNAPGSPWDLLGGVMDDDPWAMRAWDTYLTRAFPLRRTALIKSTVQVLTDRFVQDLNAWAVVRRVVLCFDDWETLMESGGDAASVDGDGGPGLERWLFDLLVEGDLSTNLWWAIAGREPLSPAWETLLPVTTRFELTSLLPDQSDLLLRECGIDDAELAAALTAQGAGNPLALIILASLGKVPSASTPTPLAACIAELDPVVRSGLLQAAAARWLDEGVLAALLGEGSVEQLQAWLDHSPLVVKHGAGWAVRPGLQDELMGLARREMGTAFEAAHRTLYAYYRQRSELWQDSWPYFDPRWQRDHLEALYHALIAEQEAPALNLAMLSFLRSVRICYPWAEAVLRVWLEASRVAEGRSEISAWGDQVRDLWAALLRKDWQAARSLLQACLDDAVWEPEVRQALQAMRQLVSARLALPLEVQASPELADVGTGEGASSTPEAPEPEPSVACALPDAAPVAETGQAMAGQARAASAAGIGEPDGADTGASPPASGTMEPPPANAVQDSEASAREHCGYANERLEEGAYREAIEAYDLALTLDPDYAAAYYNRGLAYAHLGALDNAISDFGRAIERVPTEAQFYRQRGLAYARQGAYDRAIADYNTALRHRPGLFAITYDRANAYFRLESYDRAIADYTTYLARDPGRSEAYLNRGLAYAAQGNYLEALRDYNQAIALDADRAILYSHRGQAYARLERYAEALADYERALSLDPRSATVHNNRGLLYVRIEAYAQAVASYQQAMALRPDWATPYYNGACAAALGGDVDHACIWLSRAIALREAYRSMALRDPDFSSIREHPRFKALVETL